MMLSFLAIKLVNVILSLTRMVSDDKAIPSICTVTLVLVSLKLFREMRVLNGDWDGAWCCLKPVQLSQERLQRRLQYLTKRFDDHAPYWQFVIWGRQVPLLVLSSYVEDKRVVSAVSITVCVISLVLHFRVKPFKYDFQNLMETTLMVASLESVTHVLE